MAEIETLSGKEKAIYWLKCLLELVENDRIHADQIAGLTADQVIALAETEAAKAVEGSQKLKDGQ
jgi:hypothetical protein